MAAVPAPHDQRGRFHSVWSDDKLLDILIPVAVTVDERGPTTVTMAAWDRARGPALGILDVDELPPTARASVKRLNSRGPRRLTWREWLQLADKQGAGRRQAVVAQQRSEPASVAASPARSPTRSRPPTNSSRAAPGGMSHADAQVWFVRANGRYAQRNELRRFMADCHASLAQRTPGQPYTDCYDRAEAQWREAGDVVPAERPKPRSRTQAPYKLPPGGIIPGAPANKVALRKPEDARAAPSRTPRPLRRWPTPLRRIDDGGAPRTAVPTETLRRLAARQRLARPPELPAVRRVHGPACRGDSVVSASTRMMRGQRRTGRGAAVSSLIRQPDPRRTSVTRYGPPFRSTKVTVAVRRPVVSNARSTDRRATAASCSRRWTESSRGREPVTALGNP